MPNLHNFFASLSDIDQGFLVHKEKLIDTLTPAKRCKLPDFRQRQSGVFDYGTVIALDKVDKILDGGDA